MKSHAHEHQSLRRLVDSLKQSVVEANVCQTNHLAERLYMAVLDHMKEEESAEGFFHEIEQIDPRLLSTVDQMRLQHQEIRELLERIVSNSESKEERLVQMIDQFFAIFVRHEATEERLMQEFFYQDQSLGA